MGTCNCFDSLKKNLYFVDNLMSSVAPISVALCILRHASLFRSFSGNLLNCFIFSCVQLMVADPHS